jgi:hypothetical protein
LNKWVFTPTIGAARQRDLWNYKHADLMALTAINGVSGDEAEGSLTSAYLFNKRCIAIKRRSEAAILTRQAALEPLNLGVPCDLPGPSIGCLVVGDRFNETIERKHHPLSSGAAI